MVNGATPLVYFLILGHRIRAGGISIARLGRQLLVVFRQSRKAESG